MRTSCSTEHHSSWITLECTGVCLLHVGCKRFLIHSWLPTAWLHRWSTAAALCFHTSPVLSTCLAKLKQQEQPDVQQQQVVIACSGATDGTVAIWDICTETVSSHVTVHAGAKHGQPQGSGGALQLQPSWCCQAMHQSGVNAVSAAFSGIVHAF